MIKRTLSCVAILGLIILVYGGNQLTDPYTYHFNGDSIDWPSRSLKSIYTSSGRYIARNIIPTRFQTKGLEAVMVFPRFRPGVPITLGKVELKFNKCAPKIKPFPSWELQEEGNANAIQNAVDCYLDHKNIVWVLDTGTVNTMDMPIMKGRPKVWGINFFTGKVVRVINLSSLIQSQSRLQYVVADVSLDGDEFLYISDAEWSNIIVWNLSKNVGVRVPIPVSQERRNRMDTFCIFLISPKKGENLLGFTYLSDRKVYAVRTGFLQHGRCDQIIDLGFKPGEIVLLGTDYGSIVYFRPKSDSKIYQWDAMSGGGISTSELVQGVDDTCRYCTQVAGGSRRLMWTLNSNFHDYAQGIISSVGASVSIHPLTQTKNILN